jgi:DNA invertase Pin-like site-specific DNA recombinase
MATNGSQNTPRKRTAGENIVGRAVGYVRVSTGKQAMSPAAQREKIEALAHLQDLALMEVITDRESGKEGSIHTRPGVMRVLEMAASHQVERIIIAKLDRLTRSVVDLGAILTLLDKHHTALVSATESWMDTGSAAGRMILNIVTSVAQWEREAIAERTSAVLQYKKSHGQVFNHAPYGWRAVGKPRPHKKMAGMKLEPIPAEQAVIRRIRRMRNGGKTTLRAIAERLNQDHVPTKIKGGKWYASTVANALRPA